jgi:polygalacturonase
LNSFDAMRRGLLRAGGLGMAGAVLPVVGAASGMSRSGFDSALPARNESLFDVRKFGATGDGKTLDTPAVNRAIEAAAAGGGGMVLFPAGT